MEESSVKFLNGGRVAILESDVPYAHFCMGIRTIASSARGDDGDADRVHASECHDGTRHTVELPLRICTEFIQYE